MPRAVVLLLLSVLLLGCSSTSLVYRQLDWLIPWYLDDYVSLDDAQSRQLERTLESLLDWHRREQLPRYAALVDEIRADYIDGLDAAELDALRPRLRGVWRALIERALPQLDALAGGLSAAQTEQLFAGLKERNADYADDYIDGPLDARQRRRSEQLQTQFERWLGSVGRAQQRVLDAWSRTDVQQADKALAYRRLWQQQLRETLRSREPQRRQRELLLLLTEPQTRLTLPAEIAAWREQRSRRFDQLMLDMDRLTTTAQRRHLLDRLGRLGDDFRDLAAR